MIKFVEGAATLAASVYPSLSRTCHLRTGYVLVKIGRHVSHGDGKDGFQ